MIDEGFNSVVVFDEIKLTESPEGDCNTGRLDVEPELIPLEGDCKTGALDLEPDPRLMRVLLEGDCERGGPDGEPGSTVMPLPLGGDCRTGGIDGEPGPRLIVLLEVDCKTGGD